MGGYMFEKLINCPVCYEASKSRLKKDKDGRAKNSFIVCSDCSKILDYFKSDVKVIKTIQIKNIEKEDIYTFRILKQDNDLSIDVSQNGKSFNTFIDGDFYDEKQCIEAINSWMKKSFRMSGGFMSLG
jgi:hypothetical protein